MTIGLVVAKGINNKGEIQKIQQILRKQEGEIRKKYNFKTLMENSKIIVWQKAYISFGAKPKKHKSSVENLYRLVLGGGDLRHINSLVDIYNFISLKYMLPLGGEDLAKIKGNINLTFAGSNEPQVLLLGDNEPRSPKIGEVIYKDDLSAICRRWNWREAERTKLTAETKECILVIEGLAPISRDEVENATGELKTLIAKYCGGEVTSVMVDNSNCEIVIS